jgi:signal transduction histidine kinase
VKSAERWAGVAIVVATAIFGVIVGDRLGRTDLVSATAGLSAGVAAVAAHGYRSVRDPGLLLIAAGSAALALVGLVVPALVTFLVDPQDRDLAFLPSSMRSFGPITGAAALACCLAFVVPWRERRGRPPLSVTMVSLAVGLPLLLVVMALLVAKPALPFGFGGLAPSADPGPWTILLGGVALAAGAVTAARGLASDSDYSKQGSAGLALAMTGLAVIVLGAVESVSTLEIAWVWFSSMPLVAGALLLAVVLGVTRADTSRMRRVTDRAEEVMAGRAEIAATVAHDVRGPVGTIKSLATTTRSRYPDLTDDERVEFVGMIEQESSRLLDLVNQVALALKVDAGTVDISPRHQEIAPIVSRAVEEADLGDRVHVDVPGFLTAVADTRWLQEVVRQGLSNAARFSPDGSPIQVEARRADEVMVIDIADVGPGVSAEVREAVFERFARWRPPGYEDRAGAGLGLFIARGLARSMGGDASLADGPGGGTILRIFLRLDGSQG